MPVQPQGPGQGYFQRGFSNNLLSLEEQVTIRRAQGHHVWFRIGVI